MNEGLRFALLGHPADYSHFIRLMENGGPTSRRPRLAKHERTFAKLVEWMPTYATAHRLNVTLDGLDLEGRLIVCPFLPERIGSPQQMKRAHDKVVAGCRLAKELGAQVVALGGFTSILEGAHGNRLAAEIGLAITSGNSLTAGLASAQLRSALEAADRPIRDETIAILGATGDVGRACTELLAPHAARLILVGRNRARLELLKAELRSSVAVDIDTDPRAALGAGSVIAAAGAATPIVDPAELKPGSIVCDVGFPKNLSDAAECREDVLIFSGGLAELPVPIDLQGYASLPAAGLLHGCFCEGIVLAARPERWRLGASQGDAGAARATALLELAAGLGIVPAPLYSGGRSVDPELVARMGRQWVGVGR